MAAECSVDGCARPICARGVCRSHYTDLRESRAFRIIRPYRPRQPGVIYQNTRRGPATHGYDGYVTWSVWFEGKEHYIGQEHRIVLEQHLGRPLTDREQVHHRNGVTNDNRVENLELRVGSHGVGATHCRHCGGVL